MNCHQFQSRAIGVSRGEADDRQEEALAHAASCADCREMLAEAFGLSEALSALARVDRVLAVPPAVGQRVLARWDQESADASSRVGFRTAVVAALAVAAAAAYFVVRMPPEERQPAAAPQGVTTAAVMTGSMAPQPPADSPSQAVAYRDLESPVPPPPARSRAVLPVSAPAPASLAPAGRETVTFVPLWPGDPDPAEPLQIMRVRFSRASLAGFGLPVGEPGAADDLQADVLLGEDGVARAIRLVPFD